MVYRPDAEDWGSYFNEVYPKVQKDLWEGPEKIEVCLPSEAKDKTKEQEFKQMLSGDAKKIIEELSNMGISLSFFEK